MIYTRPIYIDLQNGYKILIGTATFEQENVIDWPWQKVYFYNIKEIKLIKQRDKLKAFKHGMY